MLSCSLNISLFQSTLLMILAVVLRLHPIVLVLPWESGSPSTGSVKTSDLFARNIWSTCELLECLPHGSISWGKIWWSYTGQERLGPMTVLVCSCDCPTQETSNTDTVCSLIMINRYCDKPVKSGVWLFLHERSTKLLLIQNFKIYAEKLADTLLDSVFALINFWTFTELVY